MFKLLKNLKWIDYLFIAFILGLVVLQVWLDLKIPDYTKLILTELDKLKYGMDPSVGNILKSGGFMLACAFGSLGSAIIVGYFVANIASRLGHNLRAKVFNKIQGLSLAEINKFSTASLITRTTNDIRQVTMVLSMGIQAVLKAPIMAVWAIIIIVDKSWQWSLATGIVILIMVVTIVVIMGLAIPKFKKVQTMTDDINRVTRENLTGVRVIRASNAEEFHGQKVEECNENLTKTQLFTGRLMGIMVPAMTILMSGLTLAIYWIGAFIVKTDVDMNNMMVFSQYAMQVIMSFMMLTMIFIMLPRALVSAKRINEVLDTQNAIVSGDYKGEEGKKSVSVVVENVSFKYPDADEYVLKDISFEAKEGETVALIGSTGSGKSTLINLIPRLYEATEGRILIDGVDIKEYDLDSLNKKIGYIPQRGVLFSGTVKSNVNFGDNNADDETIKNSISIAQASNFVGRMSNGVDSAIAQGGTNVSGGQKQRLSIARAIARKPEIFIFDDSFSALDYKTDRKLRSALKKHTSTAIKIIVAQRIGTIKDANKIIVLESGKMVGMGTHEQLLKDCEVYQEIALSQLSKEEL